MESIYSFALKSAIASNMFNDASMLECISELDEGQQRRFIEAVIGIVDLPNLRASIPLRSKADTDVVCTLKEFTYMQDRVEYDYTRTDTKYFKTPEEAEKYELYGKYDWNAYKCKQEGEYTFRADWSYPSSSYCSFKKWMDNAIKEEA